MSDREALREAVIQALCASCRWPFESMIPEAQENMRRHADAAIAVVLEEAAKVADAAEKQADEDARYWEVDAGLRCQDIARDIRAMIPSGPAALEETDKSATGLKGYMG